MQIPTDEKPPKSFTNVKSIATEPPLPLYPDEQPTIMTKEMCQLLLAQGETWIAELPPAVKFLRDSNKL